MTEVIQLAEVLLPVVVNDMEQDYLLELFDDRLALAFIGFLQVAGNVVDTLAVGDWHHDAFVHRPLIFINLLDDRPCNGLDALGLAHESLHCLLEAAFCQLVMVNAHELVFRERAFHCQNLQELFLAALVVVLFDDVHTAVPDDVRDVHTDTLAHQRMATLLVDDGTLLVHDIIVLQQPLTNTEVVLLDLLLRTFDAVGNHRTFNAFAVFEAQPVHHLGDTFRAEETHQLVLKRHIEYG